MALATISSNFTFKFTFLIAKAPRAASLRVRSATARVRSDAARVRSGTARVRSGTARTRSGAARTRSGAAQVRAAMDLTRSAANRLKSPHVSPPKHRRTAYSSPKIIRYRARNIEKPCASESTTGIPNSAPTVAAFHELRPDAPPEPEKNGFGQSRTRK